MLGLDEARVRVIAPDVGGGFGVKGGPYREEAAGRVARAPPAAAGEVDLDAPGRSAHDPARARRRVDGRARARRRRPDPGLARADPAPLGATSSFTAAVNPRNHARCLPGAVPIGDVDIEVAGVFTTTPPVGAYRGAGRPEAAFLIERLVDEAARRAGARPGRDPPPQPDPARARFPFTTATGQVYDSGDYAERLARDAGDRRLRRAASRAGRAAPCAASWSASGVSTYVEPAALGWESGVVRMERSGAVTRDHRVEPARPGSRDDVRPDRRRPPRRRRPRWSPCATATRPARRRGRHGRAAGAPRWAVGALVLAARDVRDKGRRLAASMLEAASEDVVAGRRRLPRRRRRRSPRWRGAPSPSLAYRGRARCRRASSRGSRPRASSGAGARCWSAGAVRRGRCASTATPERDRRRAHRVGRRRRDHRQSAAGRRSARGLAGPGAGARSMMEAHHVRRRRPPADGHADGLRDPARRRRAGRRDRCTSTRPRRTTRSASRGSARRARSGSRRPW